MSDKGVTSDDLLNLMHMTGADSRYPKKQWGFRNHFAASVGGEDHSSMIRLEAAGFVTPGKAGKDLAFYHATEAGCMAIGMSKAAIKRALSD